MAGEDLRGEGAAPTKKRQSSFKLRGFEAALVAIDELPFLKFMPHWI